MPVVGRLTAAAAAAYASAVQERRMTTPPRADASVAATAAPTAGDAYELVVLRAVQSAFPVHFSSPLVFRLV